MIIFTISEMITMGLKNVKRLFLLIVCQEPSSIPQNDRLRLTNNQNTRACLVIKQPFWCFDFSDDSFIHVLAILT